MTLKQRKTQNAVNQVLIVCSQTAHSEAFDDSWLILSDDYMTTTILTILSFQKISKHCHQLNFEPIPAITYGVDFFFSTFLWFLAIDNPHLFLSSSKIAFYFLSLFPPPHPPGSPPTWHLHCLLSLVSLPFISVVVMGAMSKFKKMRNGLLAVVI